MNAIVTLSPAFLCQCRKKRNCLLVASKESVKIKTTGFYAYVAVIRVFPFVMLTHLAFEGQTMLRCEDLSENCMK